MESKLKIANFIVPGRAIPAVRMTQRSKFSNPAQRYLAYKERVGWAAVQAYKGEPVTSDVGVTVDIYLSGGNQGDIDNYFKSITDSLNKIIYADDRQIKQMVSSKIECEKDEQRVEVQIYELPKNR